jgi:hypothetical protein
MDILGARRLLIDKIRGTENVADVGTKQLSGPVLNKLRLMLGLVLVSKAAGYKTEETSDGE